MKFDVLGLQFDDVLTSRGKNVRCRELDVVPDKVFYGTTKTPLGGMTLVWCDGGLCYLGFEEARSLEKARHIFPKTEFERSDKRAAQWAQDVMSSWNGDGVIDVVLFGTDFQRQVWEALLSIPKGHVVSYGCVAQSVGRPKAVRAVGSAVGANPVSLLVPCHRVIQQNGSVCNYGWGDAMKQRILKEEAVAA